MPVIPFAITTGSNTLLLSAERKAEAAFTVSNISGRPLRGRGVPQPLGQTPANWLSNTGQAERDFGIGVTQQYVVRVDVPPDAAPGDYTFRLDAVGVDNPDESYTQGPVVSFHVAPGKSIGRPRFLWWIVAIVAVVLIAAIVVGAIVLSNRPVVAPASTPTASAAATAAPTVDVTATASFAATATANANATATQAAVNAAATTSANAAATQAAINAAATASANAAATQAAINAAATASANAAATQAAINAKATDDATPIPIIVQNRGGYVLSFSVRYVLNGQELSQQVDNYPTGQDRTLFVPKAATALSLQVQIAAGVQRSFNIGTPVRTCKKFSGTTLFPNIDDC